MKLVVVESPAKAKTIEKYLGPGHRVLASFGHIRDLPAKDGSVDPENGFEMTWEAYADKSKQLKAIADEAKTADTLILATDPDREGEAISWHVQEVLAKKKVLPKHVQRVTFNAITKDVGSFTLTFVAPLRTDDYNCRHDYPLQNLGFVRDGVHLSLSLEDVLHNPLVHGDCGGSRSVN